MSKYDCIVAIGCSFVHGATIEDENGNWKGNEYRFSKVLADKLNIDEVNLGRPGGSNERITRKLVEWVESNTKYKNPFVIIGLSGLSRTQIYSNASQRYWDYHILDHFDADTKQATELLKSRARKFFGDSNLWKDLKKWTELYVEFFFNEEKAQHKLQKEVLLADGYLKNKGINYILYNSLSDDIEPIKSRINYMPFKFDKTYLVDDKIPSEDCWYHYLRFLHYSNITTDFGDYSYRGNRPPYGKYFAAGHPSPEAHKELAKQFLKYIV